MHVAFSLFSLFAEAASRFEPSFTMFTTTQENGLDAI